MTGAEREPSRDELLAMAYVDGELAGEERAAFEARLAGERPLLDEVARLSKLSVIAKQSAPPEPMDHEWARLERELLHRGGHRLGFLFLLIGGLGGFGWGFYALLRSELAPLPKTFVTLALLGLVVLFLLTLRARLRTRPYDPYTEVHR